MSLIIPDLRFLTQEIVEGIKMVGVEHSLLGGGVYLKTLTIKWIEVITSYFLVFFY
jgi:hypothetical protein